MLGEIRSKRMEKMKQGHQPYESQQFQEQEEPTIAPGRFVRFAAEPVELVSVLNVKHIPYTLIKEDGTSRFEESYLLCDIPTYMMAETLKLIRANYEKQMGQWVRTSGSFHCGMQQARRTIIGGFMRGSA